MRPPVFLDEVKTEHIWLHLISSEAYKKGEKEYKGEIEKYRSEVNAGQSLNNSLE